MRTETGETLAWIPGVSACVPAPLRCIIRSTGNCHVSRGPPLAIRTISDVPETSFTHFREAHMGGTDNPEGTKSASGAPGGPAGKTERRRGPSGLVARRAAVNRAISRQRLEGFHETLSGLAIAVFGEQATVVPHLRTVSGRQWLTFVVDAADPTSVLQYGEFLPREVAFWTAYAQLVKPQGSQFMVAIRPARGWCRVEALAPMFSIMQPAEHVT